MSYDSETRLKACRIYERKEGVTFNLPFKSRCPENGFMEFPSFQHVSPYTT